MDDSKFSLSVSLCEATAEALSAAPDRVQISTFVPDIDQVMAPASRLYFNDASWLEAEGVRLVHPALPNSVAECLGAKSLR